MIRPVLFALLLCAFNCVFQMKRLLIILTLFVAFFGCNRKLCEYCPDECDLLRGEVYEEFSNAVEY